MPQTDAVTLKQTGRLQLFKQAFLNELPVQSKMVAQRMLHARLQLLVILHDHQETYATASCKEVVVFTLPRGYMRNWDCCRGPYNPLFSCSYMAKLNTHAPCFCCLNNHLCYISIVFEIYHIPERQTTIYTYGLKKSFG